MIQSLALRRPPITLRHTDAERLGHLAEAAAVRHPTTAEFLAGEVARAKVAPDAAPLPGVVCMESELTFRDDTTGKEKRVTLVYPPEADVEAGRISVLTPIGAALIGLSVGQSISFETPSGERRSLTVLSVSEPD
ncbi:nucleoside diphosphate kinase regulator [Rhodopseudomonas sp. AAP120]|jgi:regulator of nucleoside diphosphate kinase|uniref:nucleoside diphosphate kinase regulator n=1 Tax=Rhodopseudomonas sp. AAP120 TaxID=1523430 RepID=UPI0006B8B0DD|nr:nucleoside diphosphate kinase regulator [Rhodopseudomonas sp. AAP120]KPF88814.1 nucleoside diphosphate kinase regulator [Rhodopseudomonas sp. AAP120]